MDSQIQLLRQVFVHDRYATMTGIFIESAQSGGACCSLELQEIHRNITGAVQGGVFFTLADFCFAVAANAPHILEQTGRLIISLSNSITFIKQPRGNKLWAYAEQISAGHKVCSYRVKVTDEYQTAVAEMLVNGYTVTKQL